MKNYCLGGGAFPRVPGLLLALLVAGVVLGLAACSPAAPEAPQEAKTYAVADPTGDWGFPSPYAHYSRGPGYVRLSFLFDTLVWKDAHGLIPALAEKWEYLEGENTYLFHLRPGVTWHDGEKFTAGDVVFTFDYMRQHPYPFADTTVVKKAEALDELTVKLSLAAPYAPFLTNIAGTVPILPQHIWKNVEDPGRWRAPEALVGTGPFKLLDYNREQGTYLYEANADYYWGKPRVERLQFIKIGPQVAVSALHRKQVQVAEIPPELVEEAKRQGLVVLSGSHDWVAKLMINHRKEPLNNAVLRQALAYAIDRQALVDTCLRGHGLPGSPGLLPPDSTWYEAPAEQYPYDPEKAEELLRGLGYVRRGDYYEKGGQVLELELLVRGDSAPAGGSPGEREGELIKAQLERVGIKVNLRSLEAKTLDNRVAEWQFDLALSGHGGLGGDPEILNRVILGQGFNSARYQESQELNQLLQAQVREMDVAKRKALVGRVQEVYARELPALPLYYPTWYWAHDGSVNLYYTAGGVGSGVPIPLNKMAFVK